MLTLGSSTPAAHYIAQQKPSTKREEFLPDRQVDRLLLSPHHVIETIETSKMLRLDSWTLAIPLPTHSSFELTKRYTPQHRNHSWDRGTYSENRPSLISYWATRKSSQIIRHMQLDQNIILKHDDNCSTSSNFYDIKKILPLCLWFPLFSDSTGCSGNFLSALVGRARQAGLATANALFSGAALKHDGIIMTSDYSYSHLPIISACRNLLKVVFTSKTTFDFI